MILKKLTLFLILGTIASCIKQDKQVIKENRSVKTDKGMNIGQFDFIDSKILDQKRELIIYLPENFSDIDQKKDKYPVVYLLDGSYNFISFVAMLKQYSEMNDTKILPEMIVVGIPNIDFNSRMMDFSPTTDGNPEQYGGGNKFLEFMKAELFPYIEQKYSGSQNRTIVGHSFGGLVVMNALVNQKEMFTNYLCIDGSLYFDNALFLKDPNYSIQGKNLAGKNLYIGIANTATYGSTLESIKKDTISANIYVRHSLELADQIQSYKTGLIMKWHYYENETHSSAAYLSYRDSFRFFYSWFEFKKEQKYRSKFFIPKTKQDRFAFLVKEHFQNISKKIGYTFKPKRNWLSNYAYSLYNFQNQPEQALETYLLNINYYPNNPSVYKDLADFYLYQKDTANAVKNYERSLTIDDNKTITGILEKIR